MTIGILLVGTLTLLAAPRDLGDGELRRLRCRCFACWAARCGPSATSIRSRGCRSSLASASASASRCGAARRSSSPSSPAGSDRASAGCASRWCRSSTRRWRGSAARGVGLLVALALLFARPRHAMRSPLAAYIATRRRSLAAAVPSDERRAQLRPAPDARRRDAGEARSAIALLACRAADRCRRRLECSRRRARRLRRRHVRPPVLAVRARRRRSPASLRHRRSAATGCRRHAAGRAPPRACARDVCAVPRLVLGRRLLLRRVLWAAAGAEPRAAARGARAADGFSRRWCPRSCRG